MLTLHQLVVLTLGADPVEISFFNFEKEVFLLWNFHPDVKKLLKFEASSTGAQSSELYMYVLTHHSYWDFEPSEDISSGSIVINNAGKREYKKLYDQFCQYPYKRSLLTGMAMVRCMYDDMTPEELVILCCDTYPKFITKLDDDIYDKAKDLVNGLVTQEKIAEETGEYILTYLLEKRHDGTI